MMFELVRHAGSLPRALASGKENDGRGMTSEISGK
jgi:hypothetical protein